MRNLLALGLIAQTVHVAFWSPKLAVRRVEVRGAQRLAADKVRQLADVRPGGNIFRVSLGRVRQGLLQEPQIRAVSVTRRLPEAIVIRVQERQPCLALVHGGVVWEADEAGFVYRQAPSPPSAVPVVEVEGAFEPAVGQVIPPPWPAAAAECVRLARWHHLQVSKMAIDAQGELWLHIITPAANEQPERSLPVRLGRPDDLPAKFADIRLWLPQVATDGEYLNVMCAGRAAYMRLGRSETPPPSP
ncbi:MAG: FtsQ-type POTRA domain-containing protein [Armatimonadetes bacterium]|nr:FtsQ-type POTRA domain-containing protein [Armatimonadota bacterium]